MLFKTLSFKAYLIFRAILFSSIAHGASYYQITQYGYIDSVGEAIKVQCHNADQLVEGSCGGENRPAQTLFDSLLVERDYPVKVARVPTEPADVSTLTCKAQLVFPRQVIRIAATAICQRR